MPHNHPIHDHPTAVSTTNSDSSLKPLGCRCQEWTDLLKKIQDLQRHPTELKAIALCRKTLKKQDSGLPPSMCVELNVILASYLGQPWHTLLEDAENAMTLWVTHAGSSDWPKHMACLREGMDNVRLAGEKYELYLRPGGAPVWRTASGGLCMRIKIEGYKTVFAALGMWGTILPPITLNSTHYTRVDKIWDVLMETMGNKV